MKNEINKQNQSTSAQSTHKVVQSVAFAHEQYSGPIPSPNTMREYENICPGACDRLLSIYEAQVSHRIKMEETQTAKEYKFKRLGQIFGFALSVIFGCIGLFLAYIDCPKLAATIFSTLIISLVSVFVLNRNPNVKK